ncbi:stonustoxin subunit beta-like [Clupea harengus]|uniref:Stonustoxin subunit beta-like n=1 Tax=Clupea harengus TaxID=7950 RepID=A0A8M1KA51_CLUHA|nr:stonustoxin subunit beta-like [Clupea harengus]
MLDAPRIPRYRTVTTVIGLIQDGVELHHWREGRGGQFDSAPLKSTCLGMDLACPRPPQPNPLPLYAQYNACELTLDPNTAYRSLSLSEGNRKVTPVSERQPYPDHPERFDSYYSPQVLCREGQSGRCYWEAEWSGGGAHIAVAYKSMGRKGLSHDSEFGCNDKSWSLQCSGNSYSALHNNKKTDIPAPSSRSSRVGVYLDWPAGTLSFYSVSSDTLTHLHTFHSTFTEPLYPGFWLNYSDSLVSLCQIT